MTDYYDVTLKQRRHAMLLKNPNFSAVEGMLEDQARFDAVADEFQPEVIVHLAAQAGVRYSLENPRAYLDSNVIGTFTVMEAGRRLQALTAYRPQTDFKDGIARFVAWFREYYGK